MDNDVTINPQPPLRASDIRQPESAGAGGGAIPTDGATVVTALPPQVAVTPEIRTSVDDQRYRIGLIFVVTFTAGLLFIGLIVLAGIVHDLMYGVPPGGKSFLSFDNIIQLLTTFGTVVGTPLGFVVGYYFKSQEVQNNQRGGGGGNS